MEYTIQLDATKKKIITKEMKRVVEKENIDIEILREEITEECVVIPANKNHKSSDAHGVGEGLKMKINMNLGISKDCYNIEKEMEKVRVAIDMDAEAIMDLSNYGKIREFGEELIDYSPATTGSVPMYDCVGMLDRELKDITEEEFLEVAEQHVKNGVDFITIHVGLVRDTTEYLKTIDRTTKVVSRGGLLSLTWMIVNNRENPLVIRYDDILEICEKYDVILSLGDTLRLGCISDVTDDLQIQELVNLSRTVKRAYEKNVQVTIEGSGHVPIDQIEANMKTGKIIYNNAPFYVLGPLVTDIALGYDHITPATGGTIVVSTGVNFLCYVTPAEHLRLPNLEDMREGIIAMRIAAHAGDIAKKIPGARERDDEMNRARFNSDWEKMFEFVIDNEKSKEYRKESQPIEEDSCTMCGKMCSMRTAKRVLNGEDVNLI